jgi:hypothetical protein
MGRFARKAAVCLVTGITVLLAACGGGSGGSGGGGGGGTRTTTPTVTVTPASNGITVADSLTVTVTVSGTSGQATPTGKVTLSSGSYNSAAAGLSSGSATITVPAGSLAVGSDTLTASYAPDAASSSTYTSGSRTTTVSVTVATPTVKVTPEFSSIGIGQLLGVTVTVAGFSGGAVPTGSVTLTGVNGTFTSTMGLRGGSAAISIPGGTLALGSATLTASYAPDTAGSAVYASASGSATVTVTRQATPTVAVSPASPSLSTSQSLSVTVKVAGAGATLTGTVVLSSGSYHSAATTLAGGSATIAIPAYSLVFGSDTLKATYTPDAQSAATYSGGTGTATVSVAKATPTVTVTPAALNISPLDSLNVTVAVNGGSGSPVGTGTFILSGGGYTSSSTTISGATTSITIVSGALTSGGDTLTASYTPDIVSSTWYEAATGTSAAVTVSSLVSVAQGTSIGAVTDQLMGMNLAAWYDVVGNATAINAAFAQAGIKAVRWPGGSWSDAYHWNQSGGLPFLCDTTTTGVTGWGGYSTFSDFVTSIAKGGNYDLALTANYGSNATCTGGGDPTEAATWAAEAVKEGWPASHVTVGNENYGNWEYDLHTKKQDPTTYANSVIGSNGYYKLITIASPSTKVGVVVDADNTSGGWDSVVLSKAKGSYNFVEYHFYPQAPGSESDTYLVHQAAEDVTKNLNIVKSEMITAGVNVPIYVGEIGSVFSNPGKQSWSITQGLYAGQALGEMMNAGVSRLTWWIGFGNCNGTAGSMSTSLYGWQTFGAYNVFSDVDPNCPGEGSLGTMSPTARAFDLFKNIAVTGENVLDASVTGDTTNIRAYAATHKGGTALFLFNLNENQSQPVTVKLSGQGASSGVMMITYDKSLYDETHAASPTWAAPTTTSLGTQTMPMTLTLTPWSMNVVIIP